MPTTRSSHDASPTNDATLSSIMSFLDYMKTDIDVLKHDSLELKTMKHVIIALKVNITNLSNHFTSTVSTLQTDLPTISRFYGLMFLTTSTICLLLLTQVLSPPVLNGPLPLILPPLQSIRIFWKLK